MKANFDYEQKPWLDSYLPGVPGEIEIPEMSLCEAFDRATDKWKEKTALVFYGNRISFGKLRESVDRFATALIHIGIKKGDVVALLLLNSPEHIIAFYGIIKVGAILTPISPIYVSKEIKYQIEDSGAETIVCQDMLWEEVKKTGVQMKNVILTNIGDSLPRIKKFMGKSILKNIYQRMSLPPQGILEEKGFYSMKELIKKFSPDLPQVEIDVKADPMQIPYTGGTTGPAKGVILTHYNLISGLFIEKAFIPACKDGVETIVSYMPFYHAAGQNLGIIKAVLRGWLQAILTTPDPDDIINAIRRYKVTQFIGAPALFEMLSEWGKTNRVNWKRIKIIIAGADALYESTLEKWKRRTGTVIHDCWGMTETGAMGIWTPMGRHKTGSIGVPMPNCMAAIADPDQDELLPADELGELIFKGPTCTVGYWNKPAATRDCQARINNEVWLRTGDLAKMDKDGYVYIYDRKRDLIKYKGLRVYAREVEEVLNTHPKIKEAGVVGVPDVKVGENVKTYVVLESDSRGKLSEKDIVNFCTDKLAHYKIPKIIEFVGEIPKTDMGKVSRRELREQEQEF